jgi:hypothetical protein
MPGEDNTEWWGCGVGPRETIWFEADEKFKNGKAGALYYYKSENFSEAYKHIGYELHMLQDAFVPAHQAFCYHGAPVVSPDHTIDDMEYWAKFHHSYKTDRTAATAYFFHHSNGDTIFKYYLNDSEDDDDGDDLVNDVSDEVENGKLIEDGPTRLTWWKEKTNFIYGVSSSSWGTYGQPEISNLIYWNQLLEMLPGRNEGWDYYGDMNSGNNTWDWMYECLHESYTNTISRMMKRSRELPPIITGSDPWTPPAVSSLFFGPECETVFSFVVLENRTQNVDINILSDTIPIVDTGAVTWKEKDTSLLDNPDMTSLPFKKAFSISWKGGLESTTIANGSHAIKVKAIDGDNNEAEIPLTVIYDDVKPTCKISVVTVP